MEHRFSVAVKYRHTGALAADDLEPIETSGRLGVSQQLRDIFVATIIVVTHLIELRKDLP